MQDLRVLFAAAADTGYRVQITDADLNALGVEVPFTPFLAEDDYEDLRWYELIFQAEAETELLESIRAQPWVSN